VARNKREKAGKQKTSPFVVVLIVAAVMGIGVVGYAVSSNEAGSATAVSPVEIEGLSDPQRLMEMAQPIVIGDPSAPITIMEFGDYQCPACRMFQEQIKPRIELAYVQDGLAQFHFYDYPLVAIHPHAFLAARAARCAGDQQMYWEYHDALFRNQNTWSFTASPTRNFVDYAQAIGADTNEFESCLRSDRHAEVVTANLRFAEELNLPGTPSVLVRAGQGMYNRLPENSFEAIANAVEGLQQQSGPQ